MRFFSSLYRFRTICRILINNFNRISLYQHMLNESVFASPAAKPMVRCVIYCSIASSPWTTADLEELVRETLTKNAALQVFSRLTYVAGRFIQILEGPAAAIEALYQRIKADPRHHTLVPVLDRQAADRAFPEMTIFAPAKPGDPQDASDAGAPEPAEPPPLVERPESTSLMDLMASPSAQAIKNSLRVMPLQNRAINTVDRLLLAVERLVTSTGPNKLTVREVALEANVTFQTAYRYFQHTDDLLRVFVSRRQALGLQRVRDALMQGAFTSEADMAETMITILFGALQKKRAVPEAFWQFILRRHHDLQYDEIWSLAEPVFAAMRRCGIPCAHITEAEIASGLMAVIAAAKGIALRQSAFLHTRACRAMMINIFLSALGSTARS